MQTRDVDAARGEVEEQRENRWLIAVAGVVMQLALGAVYAWSVFRNPLVETFGWGVSEVTLTFTITIFTLGFAAFMGGLWMQRVSPRTVGLVAGLLYGLGVMLASLAGGRLWVLYLTYGILSGIGIGFGYIVPVAVLVKWFPDRRGFITGLAVAGFGAGALIMAPLATRLIQLVGVSQTFAVLGIIYFAMVSGAALFMKNPSEGYRPPGWEPPETSPLRSGAACTLSEALKSWQWYALWAMLFLNVTAGISVISQAAPMAEEITGVTPIVAAGLVGIIAIANGVGRLFWAWVSDFIGRRWAFLAMFLLQAVVFFLIPLTDSFLIFSILASLILLAYGGGFGTMPAFVADYFGAKNVGSIYGLMLTAWSFGGAVGPLLVSALLERTGGYATALYIIAGIMLVAAILPFILRPHDKRRVHLVPAADRRPDRGERRAA